MPDRLSSFLSRAALLLSVALALAIFPCATATAGEVVLAWDQNPEPDIASYLVYYGTASGSYTGTIDTGNQTTATLPNLPPGTYFCAVTAKNIAGLESLPSEELSFQVASPPSFPEITTDSVSAAIAGVDYTQAIRAIGGSEIYRFAKKTGTLPPGITLSTGGLLSGKPTAGGTFAFTIQVSDSASATATASFSIVVTLPPPPVVDPLIFPATIVGDSAFSYTLATTNPATRFTQTGLPKGLTLDPTTGTISGRPTQSGTFQVKVRARSPGGESEWVMGALVVEALPPGSVGTFHGIIAREASVNGGLGGQIRITTTHTGSFTGTILQGRVVRPIKGQLATRAGAEPDILAAIPWPGLGTLTLNLALSGPAATMTGTLASTTASAAIDGWSEVSPASAGASAARTIAPTFSGYYTVAMDLASAGDEGQAAIPQGTGFASITVSALGKVKIAGKLSDGAPFAISSGLGPRGEIAVHHALYSGKGSILGKLTLTESPTQDENRITGALTWLKPATAQRDYGMGFGPISLEAGGQFMGPTAPRRAVEGLPSLYLPASLVFSAGGLAAATLDPNAHFPFPEIGNPIVSNPNPAGVTLIVNRAKGLFTGRFQLLDGTLIRTVKYQGIFVRGGAGDVLAAGYFLLPQIPTPAELPSTSPILSGQVVIQQ